MLEILTVVLPVFLLVAAGYGAVRFGLFPDAAVQPLMKFAQSFAIPAMLFLALYDLDFGQSFDPRLMTAFYAGALSCFALAFFGGRHLFGMRPGESAAVGFAAFYSNAVLLGLPIMARAYGTESLGPNFALISIHAPILFLVGIGVMEAVRADGRSALATATVAAREMFRNPITLACIAGFVFNLASIPLPLPAIDAGEMLARAGLPAALFALGGVLSRYRIRSALAPAAMITAISCVVHPAIAWALCDQVFGLPAEMTRAAVVMAAMAPGVNAYVFASTYDRATGVVASTVIIGTAVSVVSVTGWLWLLGGASIG